MREELNVKISQLVDGELAADDALKLLNSMQNDAEAAELYRRYDAVSQALKTDVFVAADAGFVERVSAQLQDEPIIFRPPKQSLRQHVRTTAAIAASLAATVVIIAGALQYRDRQIGGRMEVARQQIGEQLYVDSSPMQEDDDTRFNEYLEAHGATLYAGDHASSSAHGESEQYGRVVSYGRK